MNDLFSAAKARILEMTGHEKRDEELFMIVIGKNAVRDFIKYKIHPKNNIVVRHLDNIDTRKLFDDGRSGKIMMNTKVSNKNILED